MNIISPASTETALAYRLRHAAIRLSRATSGTLQHPFPLHWIPVTKGPGTNITEAMSQTGNERIELSAAVLETVVLPLHQFPSSDSRVQPAGPIPISLATKG